MKSYSDCTLTSSLLFPMLGLERILNRTTGLIDSYVGWYPLTKDDWGNSIFVLTKPDLNKDLKNFLLTHPQYVCDYTVKDGLLFEFKIDEDYRDVVKTFLKGKYSHIDKDYVKKFIPKMKMDPIARKQYVSTNYMIVNKWDSLKQMWEEDLDVTLPEGAEVWSRPEKEKEIYEYTD